MILIEQILGIFSAIMLLLFIIGSYAYGLSDYFDNGLNFKNVTCMILSIFILSVFIAIIINLK